MGGCSFTNDGTTLTITDTRQQPGTTTPGDRRRTDSGPTTPPPPSKRAQELAECLNDLGTTRCAELMRPDDPTPAPPGLPTVTIADLASFAPAPVVVAAEPGDIAIVGMPANFVSAASAHTAAGTLFGVPISVRFTPVAYDYTYGDGSTATLATPGRTWSSLGQAQFTATPTSHVYRERGTYVADVDVRYSAEVDLGLGWVPVAGELRSDGPGREIRVLEARTALVAHTCAERGDAPGC
ncbi:hypothetical protein [Microbacterium sp. NPDC089695]|uniref:hypothetical protein n=1 Tax=Microbacterium sp. NPDC089695 TaxID=3364198 RepID=UPI00380D4ADD